MWSAFRGLRRFWFPFDTPGARRRSSIPRPPSASEAFSSPTTRSTPRERPLATARPRGNRGSFRRLGERLARRGVVADLYVFGGAAMALAYDSRRTTRDIDAHFKPHGILLEEALSMTSSPRYATSSPKRNPQRGSGFSSGTSSLIRMDERITTRPGPLTATASPGRQRPVPRHG